MSISERDFTFDQFIAGQGPVHWGTTFTKQHHRNVYPSIDPTTLKLPENYTVVITGAGKGIGSFIAKAYAKAGASHIVITARTASDLDKVKAEILAINKAVTVDTCPGDATDPSSYAAISSLLEGKRLDCLVCNAGGGGDTVGAGFAPKIHETETSEFALTVSLNYLAAYYAAKHLIPPMLATPNGAKTIINITSAASHMIGHPPLAYNMSKFATNRLTEVMAEGYRDEGLLAIAIHPGAVVTPAVEKVAPFMIPSKSDT